jgi:hypothetical protein
MTNDVTIPQSTELNPYEEYGEAAASRANIVGHLLRFSKLGTWQYGQDKEELPEGARMLVYVPSLKVGWVKWSEGQAVQHIVGLTRERFKPPTRDKLGDLDDNEWAELNGRPIDPWQFTNYLVMCDEAGEIYTYVTSSKTGIGAVAEISSTYGKRIRMKPNEIPVIELHCRPWKHRDYGDMVAPSLKITGWAEVPDTFSDVSTAIDANATESITIEDQVPPAAPAKTKPQLVKPAPKPAAAPVKSKPAPAKTKRSVRF